MMMQRWAIAVQHLLLLVWILSAHFHVSMVCSFVPLVLWNQRIPLLTPAWRQQQQSGIRMSTGDSPPSPSSTSLEDEIKQLRDQAKGMLQSLEDDMTSETTATSDTTSAQTQRHTPPPTSSNNKSSTSFYLEEDEEDLKSTRIRETRRQTLSLLEDTQWRIVFNIGREQGTWMPATWGSSGARLLLTLDVVFTPSQLYEREDFLGGVGGANVLHVVNQQLTLSPSLTQGTRTFQVKNGGWRIAPREGPAGSDLLRFFVEIQDNISHSQSDVYCPKGRIYCNCGYFPIKKRNSWESPRDRLKKELDQLQVKVEYIEQEMESDFSWLEKVKKRIEIFKLQSSMRGTIAQLNYASIVEPDPSILSFASNKQVALTREGGVCCKVTTKGGLMQEYHILGRFSIKQ